MKRKIRESSTPPEIWWRASDIARFLSVDRTVVLNWIKIGRFNPKGVFRFPGKVGDVRISNSAYEQFLRDQSEAYHPQEA